MYKDINNQVNIAVVKEHLSSYMARVEAGEHIIICRRNQPVAELVPASDVPHKNCTRLGSAKGSVKIMCDLTEPFMVETGWEMLT